MATILDVSVLSEFSIIFAWLLVFAIIFGLLEVSNFLQNKAISALIAVVVSTLMMTFPGVVTLITGNYPMVLLQ